MVTHRCFPVRREITLAELELGDAQPGTGGARTPARASEAAAERRDSKA